MKKTIASSLRVLLVCLVACSMANAAATAKKTKKGTESKSAQKTAAPRQTPAEKKTKEATADKPTEPEKPAPAVSTEKKTGEPAASKSPETDKLTRQVLFEDEWREGEVFIILPGKPLQLLVSNPDALATTDLGELSPPAGKGTVRTFSSSESTDCRWKVAYGKVQSVGDNQIVWHAPTAPGHYPVLCEIESRTRLSVASGSDTPKSRDLPVFRASTTFHFLIPYEFQPEGSGVLNGYPVGVYPNENAGDVKSVIAQHRDRYRPPRWFVPLTSATRELYVSPHFRLREFMPQAPKDATVYFPYNSNLNRILETIVEDLTTSATPEPHLRILRGFIPPYEAEQMRRGGVRLITFSRHQYGDGVVVVANNDGSDKMGDLNGDGKVDVRDAETLARVIQSAQKRLGLPGWIGVYAERPDNLLPETPMVGFDVRGWSAESYTAETPRGE